MEVCRKYMVWKFVPYSPPVQCRGGSGLEVGVLRVVYRSARAAAGARRRRGGGRHFAEALVSAVTWPVAVRIAHAGHQLPVHDRVRLAPPFGATQAPHRRVDGVRGCFLGVEEADVALLIRVSICSLPPSRFLVPRHAPKLGRRLRRRARRVRGDDGGAVAVLIESFRRTRLFGHQRARRVPVRWRPATAPRRSTALPPRRRPARRTSSGGGAKRSSWSSSSWASVTGTASSRGASTVAGGAVGLCITPSVRRKTPRLCSEKLVAALSMPNEELTDLSSSSSSSISGHHCAMH